MEQQIFPILDKAILDFKPKVALYLTEAKWRPKANALGALTTEELLKSENAAVSLINHRLEVGGEQIANIVEAMKRFSVDDAIQSEAASKVMNVFINGLALAWAVSSEYAKSTGLENLRNMNRQKEELSSEQKIEWGFKNQTDAAVALFTFAHYVVSQLSDYRKEEVEACQVRKMGLPELPLMKKEATIQCMLFYYFSYIDTKELVPNEISMLKLTREYFETVLDDLDKYKVSVKYLELFSKISYESQALKFIFSGFNRSLEDKVVDVMVREVRPEDIVGNQMIKLETLRMVWRLLTYCMKEQRNPMADLRGLVRISLGAGIPGTGKTMLICLANTLLKEYCKELGIPYLYSPLNLDIVSKYQGESVKHALGFFKPQNDLTRIVFAPIDDAESVFARRDGRESSEGTNGIVKVFLNQTEGASSIWKGNSIMPFYSNNPEVMDPAAMSRIQKRIYIKGPETVHDWLDMAHLYFNELEKQSPGIVQFLSPEGYEYLHDQKLLKSYAAGVKEEDMVPKNEVLRDIFHECSKKWNPEKNPEFAANFCFEITKKFNFWGARDARNVYSGVSDKLMDFDYTTDMINDPGKFFARSYDDKMKVILEFRNAAMKGLSFQRIFIQELVKYADMTVALNLTADAKEVKELVRQKRLHLEAERKLAQELKSVA